MEEIIVSGCSLMWAYGTFQARVAGAATSDAEAPQRPYDECTEGVQQIASYYSKNARAMIPYMDCDFRNTLSVYHEVEHAEFPAMALVLSKAYTPRNRTLAALLKNAVHQSGFTEAVSTSSEKHARIRSVIPYAITPDVSAALADRISALLGNRWALVKILEL